MGKVGRGINMPPSTSPTPRNGAAPQVFVKTSPSTSHPVKVSKSPPISWADTCKSLMKIQEEFVLQYIAPKSVEGRKVIEITKEDVTEMEEYWKNTIVLYVLGNRPSYGQLRRYATRTCKPKGAMDIYSKENGFFLVKFLLVEDLDRVLENGPWTFDGRLIVMRRWDPNSTDFTRDRLTAVPVWIRFPWLPPQLWSSHAIMKLASGIGKPLRADPLTVRKERLSYARIFVEIIATNELVEELEIELPNGKTLFQKVEYEWVPPKCPECKCFGHTTPQCPEILGKGPLCHEGTNKSADTTSLKEEAELEGSLLKPMVTEEEGCDLGCSSASKERPVLGRMVEPEPKVHQPCVAGQGNQQLFQPSGSLAVPHEDSVLISPSSPPGTIVGGKLAKKVRRKSKGANPEDEIPLQLFISFLKGQLAEFNSVWEVKSLQHFKIMVEEIRRRSYGTTSYGRRSEPNEKPTSIPFFSKYNIEGAMNGSSDSYKIGQGRYLDDTEVAVKVLDANSLGEFLQEALDRMRHPNLVKLIGECFNTLYFLVLQFLPNGSLKDRLSENPSFLMSQMRTRMIDSFLTFLRSRRPRPLVHGDLKPSNILPGASFGRELSDVGLGILLPVPIKGTEWYIDPEFAYDLCSYGVTILSRLPGKPPSLLSISSSSSTSSVKEFSYSDIERATNGLSESSKIGKGAYGSVYKGYLDNTEVAIKMLDTGGTQGPKEFIRELEVLGQLRHPNLVRLIGACFEHHSLVYEFLPNGSLEDCLENRPGLLTWQIRTRIVYEICSTLIFLHSNKPRPLLHGDLKPANVLLDGNFNIKLSDFGLCRFLPEGTNTKNFHKTKNFWGTEWYIDPDYLGTGNLCPGCDVYSFGITILRILTGASPSYIFGKVYRQYYVKKSLMKIVDSTAGAWPDHVAEYLAYIGLRCCEPEGRSRSELTMEILSDLKNTLDKIGS